MKKGTAFEAIVALVQSSLKNSPNIEITTNQIILDNAGVDREIDVLLSTHINELLIQVAIECKEYKNRSFAKYSGLAYLR